MMLTLQRGDPLHNCVTGELFCKEFACATMEPPYRSVSGRLGILVPSGQYMLRLCLKDCDLQRNYRNHFGADFHKGLLKIDGLPGVDECYVMMGEAPRHTDGSVLVGMVANRDTLQESESAYRQLYPVVASSIERGDDVMIDILDRGFYREARG